MQRQIKQPPLLLEIHDRVRDALVRPSASLIWAGVITAIMTGIPLLVAVRAAFADLGSSAPGGLDLASEPSIEELSSLMGGTITRVFLSLFILFVVALPMSYGAALVGLRSIRGETAKVSDLFVPYLRLWDFAIVSLVLILSGVIPLLMWIIAAVIVSLVVSVVIAMDQGDPTSQISTILITVLVVGIPFIFLAIYFQFRLVYAGLVVIDPLAGRPSALRAIGDSWKMTRQQNGPLSVVAIHATWALIRHTITGVIIGLFTRGLPEFVALFCGSYDVLADRLHAHSRSRQGSQ